MASLLSLPATYQCTAILPWKKSKSCQPFRVRAQRYGDEGESKHIVDDNLCILRERIEEVKIKERLERCCLAELGWNYSAAEKFRSRKDQELPQFVQLVGSLAGTFGLTVFSCTFCLCTVCVWVHCLSHVL